MPTRASRPTTRIYYNKVRARAEINEISIPLDYIVDYARSQSTQARRQAFVNLLLFWAENGGDKEAAFRAILEIQGGQTVSANCMPKEFMPYFRSETIAAQLIKIVREIDRKISEREENWDWAHVMRVMIDEGIIMSAGIVMSIDTMDSGTSEKCRMMPESAGERIIPPLLIKAMADAAMTTFLFRIVATNGLSRRTTPCTA